MTQCHVTTRAGEGAITRMLSAAYWFAAAVVGAVVGPPAHVDVKRAESELNSAEVEKLATFGCTIQDIADRFLVSEEFVRMNFPDELRRGWAIHRIGIRQAQWLYAVKKGGSALLTWLGRNALGQSHVAEKPSEQEPVVTE
jgi:hypothetical protein